MSVNNTNYSIINPASNGTVIQNNNPDELGAQESTASSSLATRTQILSPSNELPGDLVGEIHGQCVSNNDVTSIQSLACTNKHFYKNIKKIGEKINLKEFCPQLKIVSAEEARKCGFNAIPTSGISKLSLIKGYQDMAPQIEGEAGVTYYDFILSEDLTLNQIVENAKAQGIAAVFLNSEILSEIGDVPIKLAFPCMLANNVFKDSRKENYDAQCDRVRRHGCELPTAEQYIIPIVLKNKISGQCLFGQEPMTYGRSSTVIGGRPVIIGGTATADFLVDTDSGYDAECYGVGARRK